MMCLSSSRRDQPAWLPQLIIVSVILGLLLGVLMSRLDEEERQIAPNPNTQNPPTVLYSLLAIRTRTAKSNIHFVLCTPDRRPDKICRAFFVASDRFLRVGRDWDGSAAANGA
jgi:hypothetical protein